MADVVVVSMAKGPGCSSFGFAVEGVHSPYRVKSIAAGGPASETSLETGDQIARINDVELKTLCVFEVIKLVRGAGATLQLAVVPRAQVAARVAAARAAAGAGSSSSKAGAGGPAVSLPAAGPYQSISPLLGRRPLPKPKGSADDTAGRAGSSLAQTVQPARDAKPTGKADTGESSVHPDVAQESAAAPSHAPPDLVADVGLFSNTGRRHVGLNQDDLMYERVPGQDGGTVHVAAVFDGHGLLGERAAQGAVRRLRALCQAGELDVAGLTGAEPKPAMAALFAELQAAVLAEHETPPATYNYPGPRDSLEFRLVEGLDGFDRAFKAEHSRTAPIDFGCTAVVVVVAGDVMVMGNAGDAAAILCQDHTPDEADEAMLVSRLHTAKDELEIERVETDFPDKAFFTPDGYLAPLDPLMGHYEVQLTRSLGHKLLREFGVIARPYTRRFRVRPGRTMALVLSSDGVTDELSPRDIRDRVEQASSALEAAETLVRDAQSYCMDEDKVDDTTAIVLRFAAPDEADESCV